MLITKCYETKLKGDEKETMQVWTGVRCKSENGIENSRQDSHSFQQELMSLKGNHSSLVGLRTSRFASLCFPVKRKERSGANFMQIVRDLRKMH